jgi:hypothetical protein
MRKLVIALAAAACMGVMASSGAMAVPVGATVIDTAANAVGTVLDVRHHCGGCGGGWHCPPVRCWRTVCKKVYKWKRCRGGCG